MSHLTHAHHNTNSTPNYLRLTSLIRELSQLSGVDYALVTLTSRADAATSHDTYSDTSSSSSSSSSVPHSLAPFDGRHFSIYASSGFKGHFGAVVEDHLVPALIEHKQAQNLPRTVMDLTNVEALLQYLAACLYLLQQETCKNIARTWIKFIEPKKQSKYPYKRGMETAPPWWPRNVTHKEPDHLQKNERISLLSHLLLYSDFPLESLMEATNDNKDVVPSPKRVFVEQAFDIAHVYRLLNRTQHPSDGSFNLAPYTSYQVIHVHSLTYGQNRYERKEEPVSRSSSRNSTSVSYRGFGTSLPTEDNRAGAAIKRELNSSSPMMLSPGYPHGSVTPRLPMEPILSRNEPPRGYFKPQFAAPEPYRAPLPPTTLQPSSDAASKYHHYSNHYSAAVPYTTSSSYTTQQQSLGAHSAYYGGYYGQQPLNETHQMRSPPSSASSANTSLDANEEFMSATSMKRSIAVDDVRPLKRAVSR